jgi:hypothetical protein
VESLSEVGRFVPDALALSLWIAVTVAEKIGVEKAPQRFFRNAVRMQRVV